jgi:hypothetical protein
MFGGGFPITMEFVSAWMGKWWHKGTAVQVVVVVVVRTFTSLQLHHSMVFRCDS